MSRLRNDVVPHERGGRKYRIRVLYRAQPTDPYQIEVWLGFGMLTSEGPYDTRASAVASGREIANEDAEARS